MRCRKIITLSLQNIISYLEILILKLEILTGHLTERVKILILRFKNITLSFRIITFSLIILILSLVNITLCLSNYNNVSALDYSSNIGIGFTFNPTLSINISSSDLVISNLVPDSRSDSNVINVSVLTNASHGYTLAVNTNAEDLIHNDSNIDSTFSSIATNANLEILTTDNTWGYSYKLSNNAGISNNVWSNYNGLSTNAYATLLNTDNQTSKPIDFKIAAKASSTQPSGIYTGAINFIAITKPMPKTIEDIAYMQTFGELNPTDLQSVKNSMILNQDYILKDSRDEKEYYVTRLEDGNVWMTQNLDLDLSHDIPLTSEDTDLNSTASSLYRDGYNTNGDNISWAPKRDTVHFGKLNSDTWTNDNITPYSYDGGFVYPDKAMPKDIAGNHGLSGNHYNWTATVASNNSDGFRNNIADNSICPRGWRLPNSRENEFSKLLYIYGIAKDASGTTGYNNGMGIQNLTSQPIWLVRSGYISDGSEQLGYEGRYWSSAVGGNVSAYNLFFAAHNVAPDDNFHIRSLGWTVRCLTR